MKTGWFRLYADVGEAKDEEGRSVAPVELHGGSCRRERPRDTNPSLSRLVTCQNITMSQFAAQLLGIAPGYLATPVEDATGSTAPGIFTLSFSSAYLFKSGASQPGEASSASEPNGAISLFDAVVKQLGLKLEKRKRILPILVIDQMDESRRKIDDSTVGGNNGLREQFGLRLEPPKRRPRCSSLIMWKYPPRIECGRNSISG